MPTHKPATTMHSRIMILKPDDSTYGGVLYDARMYCGWNEWQVFKAAAAAAAAAAARTVTDQETGRPDIIFVQLLGARPAALKQLLLELGFMFLLGLSLLRLHPALISGADLAVGFN